MTSLRKKLEFMWPSNSYSSYEKTKKNPPQKNSLSLQSHSKPTLGKPFSNLNEIVFFVEDKAQLITNTTPAAKPCGDSIPCFTGKVKTQIKGGVGKFKRGESQGLPYYLNPALFCWTSNTCFYSVILILNLTISSQSIPVITLPSADFFPPLAMAEGDWHWLWLVVTPAQHQQSEVLLWICTRSLTCQIAPAVLNVLSMYWMSNSISIQIECRQRWF